MSTGLAIYFAFLGAICVGALLIVVALATPSFPRCPEDAVILGGGEYNGQTQKWDYYYCGPSVDDYNG